MRSIGTIHSCLRRNIVNNEAVSIADIDASTGLAKDVIRKWEIRYGYPRPLRDANGDRLYPADQVTNLRLIRRLIDGGIRPSKVVGLDYEQLKVMSDTLILRPENSEEAFADKVLKTLQMHNLPMLSKLLRDSMYQQGLQVFVQLTLPALNAQIGNKWLNGDLKIFEEHLYTQTVEELLQGSLAAINDSQGSPRILCTTPPGELHTIGLQMAKVFLSLHGALCIGLGAQTPAQDIAEAAVALAVDIVGISFSLSYATTKALRFLRDLRSRLPPSILIWAGGMGTTRISGTLPGIRFVTSLNEATLALNDVRSQATLGLV